MRDVVSVVNAARELGLRVAPQSTGHNAGPLGDLDGTILLKTSAMRDVQIDPVARVARVEAGAMWMDVTPAAAEHGLAALAGSAPDVGVAGYTLGGGLSWLARSHGLAANSVVAIEVVTADGVLRRVDETHEPELFWALRGGGGSFGVVTAIEFRLYPITEVYAGVLFFPLDRAAEVLEAWRQWLPSVPDSVTSVGRILRFPPIPDLPPLPQRPVLRRRRGCLPAPRRRGRGAARPAACARSGDRHLRHDHRSPRSRSCTWTRPVRCRARVTARCWASCTTETIDAVRRRRRSWRRARPCCRSSCVTSVARSPRAGCRVVPSPASTQSSPCSRSGSPRRRRRPRSSSRP